MKSLLLAPHHDDEVLWCSWSILRYQPHVIICLRSDLQEKRGMGITNAQRVTETSRALWWLGDPSSEFWQFSDANPDWEGFKAKLYEFAATHEDLERVFAPAVEEGGHDQHNEVGRIAVEVFGGVEPYLTYVRGSGRSIGTEVPFEPGWPAKKLRALSCYESQIAEPSTAYWFLDSGLREYTP